MQSPTRRDGAGHPATFEPRLSVFLNVPYDGAYEPILRGLVFTCVCCGFWPRCGVDSGSTSIPRMDRIAETLATCKYSIHDLCRCRGEGADNLARFNMPFELGMAFMLRHLRRDSHDWLFLVNEGQDHRRFVSDLSGHDPKHHSGTIESVIPPVMAWLLTREHDANLCVPNDVLRHLPEFGQRHAELVARWNGHLPWPESVLCAIEVARDCRLIPQVQT